MHITGDRTFNYISRESAGMYEYFPRELANQIYCYMTTAYYGGSYI